MPKVSDLDPVKHYFLIILNIVCDLNTPFPIERIAIALEHLQYCIQWAIEMIVPQMQTMEPEI